MLILTSYLFILILITFLNINLPYENIVSVFAKKESLLLAETILFHIPALLKISHLRSITSTSPKKLKYPEILIFSLVIIFWAHLILISNGTLLSLSTGAVISFALAITLLGPRVMQQIDKKLSVLSPLYGLSGSSNVIHYGSQYIYIIRTVVVLISLTIASSIILDFNVQPTELLLIIVSFIFGIITVSMSSASEAKRLADINKSSTRNEVIAAYDKSGATVAIYSSNPNEKEFSVEIGTIEKILKENLSIGAILRESHGKNLFIKAGANPVFYAPTIDTLDHFSINQIKIILYINNARKNGHFVRFQNHKHILIPGAQLEKKDHLPKGIEMYDAVIAPSLEKAWTWIENSNVKYNIPIVVIRKSDINDIEINTNAHEKLTLSVYIDLVQKEDTEINIFNTIGHLIDDCNKHKNISLVITVNKASEISYEFIKLLNNYLKNENADSIKIHAGSIDLANKAGDIKMLFSPIGEKYFHHRAIYLNKNLAPPGSEIYSPGRLVYSIENLKNLALQENKEKSSIKIYENYRTFFNQMHVEEKL